jgi:hypothetical protein
MIFQISLSEEHAAQLEELLMVVMVASQTVLDKTMLSVPLEEPLVTLPINLLESF